MIPPRFTLTLRGWFNPAVRLPPDRETTPLVKTPTVRLPELVLAVTVSPGASGSIPVVGSSVSDRGVPTQTEGDTTALSTGATTLTFTTVGKLKQLPLVHSTVKL